MIRKYALYAGRQIDLYIELKYFYLGYREYIEFTQLCSISCAGLCIFNLAQNLRQVLGTL